MDIESTPNSWAISPFGVCEVDICLIDGEFMPFNRMIFSEVPLYWSVTGEEDTTWFFVTDIPPDNQKIVDLRQLEMYAVQTEEEVKEIHDIASNWIEMPDDLLYWLTLDEYVLYIEHPRMTDSVEAPGQNRKPIKSIRPKQKTD